MHAEYCEVIGALISLYKSSGLRAYILPFFNHYFHDTIYEVFLMIKGVPIVLQLILETLATTTYLRHISVLFLKLLF